MHFAWDAEVPGWMRRCMAVVGEGGGCGWQRNLIVPSGGPCQGDIALQFPFLNFIQLSTSGIWGSSTMTSVGSEDESLWCWTRLSGWSWSETGKSGERLLLVWEAPVYILVRFCPSVERATAVINGVEAPPLPIEAPPFPCGTFVYSPLGTRHQLEAFFPPRVLVPAEW